MVKNHFDLEADSYDQFDANHEKRRSYTAGINQLISLRLPNASKVLSVACGTGRRDLEIRFMAKQNYEIYGVEISGEMSKIATKNGIKCDHANWLDFKSDTFFDAAFFLYAFGAIPDSNDRLLALRKIKDCLAKNTPLYMDVLNIDDKNEWGLKIKNEFDQAELGKYGYELGDILYSKIGETKLAYWHYFSKQEIEDLLKQAGFKKINIQYIGYGKFPGKIVSSNEGAIFIEAFS
ncbi:MAG: class I SAM-dependent methyltransferase [Bacteriovoracaceae bacterium]|nr:class I SAM-dependent methyltransferase [Bacteriovoracaceae bacterium]